MEMTTRQLKQAMKEVLAEEAKEKEEGYIQPIIIPPLKEPLTRVNTSVLTQDVADSFLHHKQYKGVKEGSSETYQKSLQRFARKFPELPLDTETVMEYMGQFTGDTGRYKRNQHDDLNQLYKHAVRHFGIPDNPFDNLERPLVTHKPIRTLSLKEACKVDSVVETIRERAVWELAFGHGWRQIEVRRVTSGDVRSISDGIIWVWGKERDEYTPLLPETQGLLQQLAGELPDDEPVIRSTRRWAGRIRPLGADGMRKLIQKLFHQSGIQYKGHDLRRTFCTMVGEASGNELLAMRLARDKVPGVNDRYIKTDLARQRESLLKYSPIRQIRPEKTGETLVKAGESLQKDSPARVLRHEKTGETLVEAGESRTPRPREATQNILQA